MVSNMMQFRYNIVAPSHLKDFEAPGSKALPVPGQVLGPKYGTQGPPLKNDFKINNNIYIYIYYYIYIYIYIYIYCKYIRWGQGPPPPQARRNGRKPSRILPILARIVAMLGRTCIACACSLGHTRACWCARVRTCMLECTCMLSCSLILGLSNTGQ
jgi:hypothetical protein